MDAPATVLAPFTARDGENLALFEWPLDTWFNERGEEAAPPRGVVLIIHGLGEHAMRYDALAGKLMAWGFAVRAYDQRGHGESSGARGTLPSDTALLEDLAEIIDDTRLRCLRLLRPDQHPLPLVLLGHSMGGLVAARFVSLNIRPVEGLVLSSPAFDAGLNPIQRWLLKVMSKFAPNLCVHNGLNARFISHDRDVVNRYLADPLMHDRISMRLGRFIAVSGQKVLEAVARWSTPTLLMYAGADQLVKPAGSRAFAQAAHASESEAGMVTSCCFDSLYHEIFNETDAKPVFSTLQTWLEGRFEVQKEPRANSRAPEQLLNA